MVMHAHTQVLWVCTTPLGKPRRARGVHDVEHVVVAGADRRFGRVRRVPKRPVVRREIGDVAVRDLEPLVDVGLVATRMQIGHGVDEVIVEEEPRRAAVLQDEFQFVGDQAPVQRHHDGADLRQGEVRLDELGAVHQQQPDPFAFLNSRSQKRIRGLVAAGIEFAERQPFAAAAIDRTPPGRASGTPAWSATIRYCFPCSASPVPPALVAVAGTYAGRTG